MSILGCVDYILIRLSHRCKNVGQPFFCSFAENLKMLHCSTILLLYYLTILPFYYSS